MAISVPPSVPEPRDADPELPAPPVPPAIHDALKLVSDLARSLDGQCRRAHRLLDDDPTASPDLRRALEGVATHAREAADRAPALQATRAREAADPAPALQSARDTRPSGGANHPDTRECAVALALTLKLDGAAPEDVETWLRDEFGRSDAASITEAAFGSK